MPRQPVIHLHTLETTQNQNVGLIPSMIGMPWP